MIVWNRQAVENFLGVTASRSESVSPLGTHVEFIFEIPMPGGPLQFSVRPSQDHCQFYAAEEHEFVSAHVHCTRIVISDESEEEGGGCLVLQGKAGHACVTPGKPFFRLFFSMHGQDTTRPPNVG